MALTRIGGWRDFLLGAIIPDPTSGGKGTVDIQAITLVDTAGAAITSSTTGGLLVTEPAMVSAANSSATPLLSGAVFTGTAVGTLNYGSIGVNVFADQTGTLSVQQSSDGTNWDITDTYTVAASSTLKVLIPRQGAFERTVYTNGGTNQGAFRLQTTLNPQMPTASAVSPTDGMSIQNDFVSTLNVPEIYNGTTLDIQRSIQGAANTGVGTAATAPTKLSGTGLTRATVNITTIATTEIVALTAGQTIRVYKIMLNISATQTINFTSNGVSLNGAAMSFSANSGLILDFDGEPWLVGTVAQNLALVTTAVGTVTGVIYYVKSV